MTTLTHHKKSVRAMALHPTEFTFSTASPDNIKQWKCPEGQFMRNFEGPGGVTGGGGIVNAMAVNADNVMFTGGIISFLFQLLNGCLCLLTIRLLTSNLIHIILLPLCS